MANDKVIVAEYMPVFGWTKVRHTSKFEGKPRSDGIRLIRSYRNPAYIVYHGKKYCNAAMVKMFPKQAAKMILITGFVLDSLG